MSPCLRWPLMPRGVNLAKEISKGLPLWPCSRLLFPQPFLRRWCLCFLHQLLLLLSFVPKGRARSGRVFGRTQLLPLAKPIMSSLTRSWGAFLLYLLISSSIVISTSWCRYVVYFSFLSSLDFILQKYEILAMSLSSRSLVNPFNWRLTTDYLSVEEKVVVALSKAEFAEAESSRLRKDLVETMD